MQSDIQEDFKVTREVWNVAREVWKIVQMVTRELLIVTREVEIVTREVENVTREVTREVFLREVTWKVWNTLISNTRDTRVHPRSPAITRVTSLFS